MKKTIIILMLAIFIGTIYLFPYKIEIDSKDYMTGSHLITADEVSCRSIIDNIELNINKMEINDEDDFSDYIKGIVNEEKNILSNDDISNEDKKILENTFVDFADFIFYDKEIKGYRFRDLSLTTKKSILSSFKKFDSIIEDRYPNYKRNLESLSKNNYNNMKDKVNKMLDDYQNQIKVETYKSCHKENENLFSKINKWLNDLIKKVSD